MMSDTEESISSDTNETPQRAPAPPSNFQSVETRTWNSDRCILVAGLTDLEWNAWWSTTPWRRRYPRLSFTWHQHKKTSDVWSQFQSAARSSDGRPFVRCTRCTAAIRHPSIKNSGTTALNRHLTTKECQRESKRKGLESIHKFLLSKEDIGVRNTIIALIIANLLATSIH